jgi:hypothetical protein
MYHSLNLTTLKTTRLEAFYVFFTLRHLFIVSIFDFTYFDAIVLEKLQNIFIWHELWTLVELPSALLSI